MAKWYLFSVVELVALRRVAPRPAAHRLPANRAVRENRSAAARGGVVAARQPLPLNRYEAVGCFFMPRPGLKNGQRYEAISILDEGLERCSTETASEAQPIIPPEQSSFHV